MNKIVNKSKTKGFTLIELLIVISVMGILSGVMFGVINVNGLRSKARDSQRIADIKKIQTALELYFTDNRRYPESTSWASTSTLGTTLVSNYISSLPTDPTYTGTSLSCNSTTMSDVGYLYRTSAGGSRYLLVAKTEVPTSAAASPCSSQSNCSAFGGCNSCSFACYGAQNPL